MYQSGRPSLAWLLLAMLAFAPGHAVAQGALDLFAPAPATSARAAGATVPTRGIVREALLELRTDALEQALSSGVMTRAAVSPRLRFSLFPDIGAEFVRRDVEAAFAGGSVWTGDGPGESAATLVVRNGMVTAQIVIGTRVFRIEPVAGLLHRVIEIDPAGLPADAPHQVPRHSPHSGAHLSQPRVSSAAASKTVVDLLVGYTAAADTAPGDIIADITLAVALTNQAYVNSGISMRVKLRGTMRTAYNETAVGYTTTLFNLTNLGGEGSTASGRAAFNAIRTRRDRVGADLVTLIREGGSYCGQAWVVETPSAATSGYGYSQVSRGCIAGYTLAHEFGHNMGLLHDRYVEPAAPASKYNFGYVHVAKRIRDIMSYPHMCSAAGAACAVQNMFSTPRKTIAGVRFGIAAGLAGAADASRRLNETRLAISAYRSMAAAAAQN